MKTFLLTTVLLSSSLFAQDFQQPQTGVQMRRPVQMQPPYQAQNPAAALKENYGLNLVITDADGKSSNVSLLVAGSQFSVQAGELDLNFSGQLVPDEDGSALVTYTLTWFSAASSEKGTDRKQSSAQATLRLSGKQPVQILQAGSRSVSLAVFKTEKK